jgi:hypothetical protein
MPTWSWKCREGYEEDPVAFAESLAMKLAKANVYQVASFMMKVGEVRKS